MSWEGVLVGPEVMAAHAVVMVKFEEGLAEGGDQSLAALLELVDDQLQEDEQGRIIVPSQEPHFEEVKGSMVAKYEPVLHDMLVKPKQYAGLVRIGERELRLDRYQAKATWSKTLGVRASQRKGDAVRLSIPLLRLAKTLGNQFAFSTQQYIDPSRGLAGGYYPNLYYLELNGTNYEKVYAEMQARTDEGGVPRRTKPTHLLVSPQLRATGRAIIGLEQIPGVALGNPNYDAEMKLVVVEDLPPKAWMLGSNKGTIKPIGYHQTLRPRMMYFGTEKNGLVLDHLWRADVEDQVLVVAPYKLSYSDPDLSP